MFWKNLYDSFLQSLTSTWGEVLRTCGSEGRLIKDNFQNKVYPDIGLYLAGVTLITVLIYYYYLNAKFGRYYSIWFWFLTLLSNSIIIFLITYMRTQSILNSPVCNINRHILYISFINAFFAALLFFIMSLIVKWKSPMGKKTPF